MYTNRGRATDLIRGSNILPYLDELRILLVLFRRKGQGAKVLVREGKNPDHQLRSQNIC